MKPHEIANEIHAADKQTESLPDDQAKEEPLSPYELAYKHVTNGGTISAKAIQEAAGVKRRAVTEIILALARHGIISEPDDDGLRTLIADRPMTAAEVKHGYGAAQSDLGA